MPRSKLKVLGKPEYTNVVIAAHAIHVRTTMPPLVFFENFLGFQLQDSITLLFYLYMSWRESLNPTAKILNNNLQYRIVQINFIKKHFTLLIVSISQN